MTLGTSALPFSLQIWLVQMIAYHSFGLWFQYLDTTAALRRYKNRDAERRGYFQILPRVLANQCLILAPAMWAFEALGLAYVGPEHLSWLEMLVAMVGLAVGHDVVQYISHRAILHRAGFMRSLGHAVHHTTGASLAISACFMSGADFFLEIALPYLAPLAIVGGCGTNVYFHSFVVAAGAFGGLYEHSGYDFGQFLRKSPGDDIAARIKRCIGARLSTEAHGAHHTRGNVSFSDGFGSSNICDTIFRTRYDLVPRG
jgi:sterol desaturase/sphingolipid hydroxylase (fatty acid hydroxylase superfamily)